MILLEDFQFLAMTEIIQIHAELVSIPYAHYSFHAWEHNFHRFSLAGQPLDVAKAYWSSG